MFKSGTGWLCLLAGDAACPTVFRPVHSSEMIFSCYSRRPVHLCCQPQGTLSLWQEGPALALWKSTLLPCLSLSMVNLWAPGLQFVSISVCPWSLTSCGSKHSSGALQWPACLPACSVDLCLLIPLEAATSLSTHSKANRGSTTLLTAQTSHMSNGSRYWWKNIFTLCQLAAPYTNQRGKNKTAAAWAFIWSSLPLSFGNAASTQLSYELICHWKR